MGTSEPEGGHVPVTVQQSGEVTVTTAAAVRQPGQWYGGVMKTLRYWWLPMFVLIVMAVSAASLVAGYVLAIGGPLAVLVFGWWRRRKTAQYDGYVVVLRPPFHFICERGHHAYSMLSPDLDACEALCYPDAQPAMAEGTVRFDGAVSGRCGAEMDWRVVPFEPLHSAASEGTEEP